ncbi:MAG TPA: hypothetical protein VEW94_05710 [Chloroflexia bacterium]|nr:hypothetical protein [Chloroflexia bacterium]
MLITVSVLAPGVWVIESETGRNTGLVARPEGAMLINPMGSEDEHSAVEQILAEAGRAVTSIIFTHSPQEDAPSLAGWPAVPRLGLNELAGSMELVEGWEALTFGRPDVSAALLYGRQKQVIFSGGMMSGDAIPTLAGGSQGYSDALERVQDVGARFIVPSQGTVARGEQEAGRRIESDLSYIYSLRRHVITSIVAAVPMSRALAVAEAIYEDYPFVQTHVENMRYVWEELSERGE